MEAMCLNELSMLFSWTTDGQTLFSIHGQQSGPAVRAMTQFALSLIVFCIQTLSGLEGQFFKHWNTAGSMPDTRTGCRRRRHESQVLVSQANHVTASGINASSTDAGE